MLYDCLNVYIHIHVYKMLYRKCNDVFSTANSSNLQSFIFFHFLILELDHTPKSFFFIPLR